MRPFFHTILSIQYSSCIRIVNFDFQGPIWVYLGSKLGQIWPQKAKNLPKRLEIQLRPFFHTILSTQYSSCIKIAHFNFQGPIQVYLGSKLGQIQPQKAKNVQKGLESQMRPSFHTVLSTECGSCIKISNFDFQGPIWVYFGSKLAPKAKKSTYRPTKPNEPIFPHSFKY